MKMKKPADLTDGIGLLGLLFEPAEKEHTPKKGDRLIRGETLERILGTCLLLSRSFRPDVVLRSSRCPASLAIAIHWLSGEKATAVTVPSIDHCATWWFFATCQTRVVLPPVTSNCPSGLKASLVT